MPIPPSRESDCASGNHLNAGELRAGEQIIGPLPTHNPLFVKRSKTFEEVLIEHPDVTLRVHVFTVGEQSWLVIRAERGDVRVRRQDVGHDFLTLRSEQRVREAAKRSMSGRQGFSASHGRLAPTGTEAPCVGT